jgi:hypothetical protein
MSRAYRIKVSESLNRIIRASDHVSTQLEILEILPSEAMAELLEQELRGLGFERNGEVLVREQDGVLVSVDPKTGIVTARIEADQSLKLEREGEANVYDFGSETAKQIQDARREQLRQEMEKDAKKETEQLQKEVTDRLEAELIDLRQELDQAVNRVTASALKPKAAQLGQIKSMTEDQKSGSLTIVLEV